MSWAYDMAPVVLTSMVAEFMVGRTGMLTALTIPGCWSWELRMSFPKSGDMSRCEIYRIFSCLALDCLSRSMVEMAFLLPPTILRCMPSGESENSCFSISDFSSARLTCAFRRRVEVVSRPLS